MRSQNIGGIGGPGSQTVALKSFAASVCLYTLVSILSGWRDFLFVADTERMSGTCLSKDTLALRLSVLFVHTCFSLFLACRQYWISFSTVSVSVWDTCI